MTIKLLLAALLFAFTLTNCTREDCQDWYEGDDCSIQERDKFYGVYVGVFKTYDLQGNLKDTHIDTVKFISFLNTTIVTFIPILTIFTGTIG